MTQTDLGNFKGNLHYCSSEEKFNSLPDKQDGDLYLIPMPPIPTALADLTQDATHRTITDAEKATYDGYATTKQNALDSNQMNAVNSGITAGKVATYDAYSSTKQNALDTAQMNAVNSGITPAKVTKLDTVAENAQVNAVEGIQVDGTSILDANKIANLITTDNVSATDSAFALKGFVNSSISTNTAYFKGTYDVVNDLGLTIQATHEQVATALANVQFQTPPTNNDYVFVSFLSGTSDDRYERYKFIAGTTNAWAYEYSLNNSSFTQAQWDAINSNITSAKVTAYDAYAGQIAGKQDALPSAVNDRYLHTNATTGALEWDTVSSGHIYLEE